MNPTREREPTKDPRSRVGSHPGTGSAQLIAAGDKLVLLISPTGLRGGEMPIEKRSYIYLVDPKTGKAQLVWKEKLGGK